MNTPFVFVIVVQYNNSEDTLNCLDSLRQLKYPNFKVAVIDNASEEAEKNSVRNYIKSQSHNEISDSLAAVEKLHSEILLQDQPPQANTLINHSIKVFEIEFLENQENLGYAGGNNIGIKYAIQNGADYVFVLNNDTTVEPDSLEKLVKAAEADPKVGIVGPAINENGKITYGGKITWLKPELKHPLYPRAALGYRGYVSGAAMLIKKEVLEKVEGFDEVYFLYFEDADFCIRAQWAGFKLKIVPEAIVHHKVSASTSKLGSPLVLRYHMRNALIFNSLNAPWFVKPLIIFWAGWVLLKNLVKISLFPEKEAVGEAIVDGVLDFYKNKGGKITS